MPVYDFIHCLPETHGMDQETVPGPFIRGYECIYGCDDMVVYRHNKMKLMMIWVILFPYHFLRKVFHRLSVPVCLLSWDSLKWEHSAVLVLTFCGDEGWFSYLKKKMPLFKQPNDVLMDLYLSFSAINFLIFYPNSVNNQSLSFNYFQRSFHPFCLLQRPGTRNQDAEQRRALLEATGKKSLINACELLDQYTETLACMFLFFFFFEGLSSNFQISFRR